MDQIIIIGVDHHNTLSLVRILGRRGYKVTVILYGCYGNSFIASSKYCSEVFIEPDANEAISKLKGLLSVIKEIPVVLTGADQISSLMDLEYDYFSSRCFFFNAGQKERITSYMDKQTQTKLAAGCGFNTPFSIDCAIEGINNLEIPFPCILKPRESIHGGKDILICSNKEELESSIGTFSIGNSILLQQFISKEKEIVILGYAISGNSTIAGFIDKHREYKGATTYSTTHSIQELPGSLIESCRSMIQAINYTGLWGIELIKNNNKYYFIELNLRNDATTYSIVLAGFDIVDEYCKKVRNAHYFVTEHHDVKCIDSMVEFEDFNFVLKRKVPLVKWLKEKKHSDCLFFYDSNDMNPYKIRRRLYLSFLLHRFFHK